MSVTLVLISVNVLISMLQWSGTLRLENLSLHPYSIFHKKQWYRFFSHGFVHSDMAHLFFNMFTLYFFGSALEDYFLYIFDRLHSWIFSLLYFSALVFSDFYNVFRYRNYSGYSSIGASGAVSAVLFAYIFLEPTEKLYVVFVPIGIPGVIAAILYLVYMQYSIRYRYHSNINHIAHFTGALYGIVFMLFFYPQSIWIFTSKLRELSLPF